MEVLEVVAAQTQLLRELETLHRLLQAKEIMEQLAVVTMVRAVAEGVLVRLVLVAQEVTEPHLV
jgi:hypothetical protein